MALSGKITGTCDNSHYTLTCEWSATQNIANNTSTITAKVYLNGNGYATDSNYWDCTINGTQVTNDKDAYVSGNTLLGQRTWTVTHTSSGTCSTTISFSYSNGLTSKGTYTTKTGSGSGTITLDTIPRTSSFTLSKSSMDMGASQTVNISRASSSFTHTIQYTFGDTTITSHTKTGSTSVSFTPSVDLANKIPNATSGTCTVKVTTYSGNTSIGSSSKTFTLTVPSDVKPTVTALNPVYNNTLNGLTIAGKSTVKVTPSASGSYGSTIKSYSYSGAGLSGTGSTKTTGTLSAGTHTITVTATDSRGRTNTASVSFTAYAYSAPTCSISCYRTDSSGNANASGTYAKLRLTWNISNPNSTNANTHTFKIEWKKASDTTWSSGWKGGDLGNYNATNYIYDGGSGWVTTTSYNIKFTVTDSFGSASAICTLSTINALLNLEKNGVGIGKIYERGKLDINGDTYSTRFIANGNSKNAIVGTGTSDIYLYNSASGKYLQLKDNGTLSYSDKPILMGTITGSGNRWGVYTMIGDDGVMEVGKYLDFHESDGDTSDYALRITSSGGNLLSSGHISPNNNEAVRFGYSSSEACTYITNNSGNWLRLTNDGVLKWRGWNVLHSNGTQTISGTLKTGTYANSYQGVTFKRKTDDIGNYLGKIGCSVIGSTEPTVTIEVGKVADTSNDSFADGFRRFSFGSSHFLTHTNNAVDIGSSNFRFKAVYATNGTIQTSDGRYKYILENIKNEKCYNLIRDMNLYGYSTLNKRIDEYVDTTEISDELQQSSQEDMNLHMGFVAQEIEDNELAKYILIKDELEDEDGAKTGEHIYSVDNYAYTTAIHGALQHEIKLRQELHNKVENLKQEIENLKQEIKSLKE